MNTLMTVQGPKDPDRLGRVLVHEHVVIGFAGDELEPALRWDRHDVAAIAADRFAELHDHGVETIVDPCPIELGRDPEILVEVAERSGIDLVCATGFYMEADGVGIPWYWRQRWPEEIAELYLHEIEHGIGATGIRPGVIKVATGRPFGRHERKVAAGAAIAARESGIPLITHTEHSHGGIEQLELLLSAGATARRCLIGHQDEAAPQDVVAIAATGAFVGVDRVGAFSLASDEHRVDIVRGLVGAGLVGQLCLSQDRTCVSRSARPPAWIPRDRVDHFYDEVWPGIEEETRLRPFSYLFTDFLPRLREAGVTADQIETILVDNPRRLLCGEIDESSPAGTQTTSPR